MDPILGVAIGLSMPMLFGFMLGYRAGKQAKSKEILEAMSRQASQDMATDWCKCHPSVATSASLICTACKKPRQ